MKRSKIILAVSIIFALILSASCSSHSKRVGKTAIKHASNLSNICDIFKKNPSWRQHLQRTYDKWGIPIHVVMATIYQESKFIAHARPQNYDHIPGQKKKKYLSSAYGYSQAIDSTWKIYKKVSNNKHAQRHNFSDSVDFMGWYMDISYKKNDISKQKADLHYLNYHEGWLGYSSGTYQKKKWLLKIAQAVQAMSLSYKRQLYSCSKRSFMAKRINNKNTWF
jgi:hypothetical protein